MSLPVTSTVPAAPPSRMRRLDVVFLLILAGALLVRLQLAATQSFIHDENHTSIPLSRTISLEPGHVHLPLRGENHGATPAYFVKASSVLFGESKLGYRAVHLLASLGTIALVYLLVLEWYGVVAARWASALLAFNEYYVGVSARATAHVPHLLFDLLALFAFSRFLRTSRPAYLYAAGAAVGFAFYCKETSALLLPVFLLALLLTKNRRWLRQPHPYVACGVFVLLIAPDLAWNLETKTGTAEVHYDNNESHQQATYTAHLRRVGGLGFSVYPTMFYERDAVESAYRSVTGAELVDETPEYASLDPVLGALLLAAVIVTTAGVARRDELRKFLLIAFWFVFVFFTLIRKGTASGRLDPVSWMWVETTILPATVIAGVWLAGIRGGTRLAVWALAAAALVYACAAPLLAIAQAIRAAAWEVVSQVSHAGQVTAMWLVIAVRERPLFWLAVALGAGLVVGAVVGFVAARMVHRRTP